MKYVLYAYSYENGWESFFVTKKNMQEKIDSLDPKEYGRYYVVNNKTPKLYACGIIEKVKTLKKDFK
jgi:hypothetical protein